MIEAVLQWEFSLTQILALLGIIQCVYALVYIGFNAEKTARIIIPSVFYLVLALCFVMDFSLSHYRFLQHYMEYSALAFWGFLPAFSYLLIIQLAQIRKFPHWSHFLVLVGPVLSFGLAKLLTASDIFIDPDLSHMQQFGQWKDLLSITIGGVTLLAVWLSRKHLDLNWRDPAFGRPRYWLIMCLIIMNLALLSVAGARVTGSLGLDEWRLIRLIIGLTFIYLVVTSLFRIYPLPIQNAARKVRVATDLSDEDKQLVSRIDALLLYEKVYQESSYSRASLAKELGVSEATVSRVMNEHYKKSIPQLLNEYRIAEAKQLLQQTDAPVQMIAHEAGFQSLATFNRVFREIVRQSPSEYRLLKTSK